MKPHQPGDISKVLVRGVFLLNQALHRGEECDLVVAVSSGGTFAGMTLDLFAVPVTLGIILGLLVGKPVGIVGFIAIAVLLRIIRLPHNISWGQVLGVAFAAGIGFTMSLFIAGLAFERGGVLIVGDRLGVLTGSVLSAIAAWIVLNFSLGPRRLPEP